ncbi:MAG: hypothetical protein JWO89_2099, partial [Verrucomicrobiaceae bacterium]|nr:hypothetical protein [Verrucomicrobiaceae bacterium]
LAEWALRSDPGRLERDAKAALADPIWRLGSGRLYRCLNKPGRGGLPAIDVAFVPSDEQRLVIWCIMVRGWRRIIIPKARQLGMSLVLCLIGLDKCLFTSGLKAALVDKTGPDAAKKLSDKVVYAYDRLPASLRAGFEAEALSGSFEVKTRGMKCETPSVYEAGISFRGGTVEWLHISEWGEIQAVDRRRSMEIRDGSLPAAEGGIVVVETTWKGGLDGEPGALVQEAQAMAEEHKGPESWRVIFFPWYGDATCSQAHGYMDAASARHLDECAAAGVVLTREQRLWYAQQMRTKGLAACKSQYPTFMHECWESVPEGSIYGTLIEQARADGRIREYAVPDTIVDTYWDLGAPVNTVCWFVQRTGGEIRVLGADLGRDMMLEDRLADYAARGWRFGAHWLPHDAGIGQSSGRTQAQDFRATARSAGLEGSVRVVPRVADVWQGIEALKLLFPRMVFRSGACRQGMESLARYAFSRESSTGMAKDEPIHDRYSHAADALRQLAQSLTSGPVEYETVSSGFDPYSYGGMGVEREEEGF